MCSINNEVDRSSLCVCVCVCTKEGSRTKEERHTDQGHEERKRGEKKAKTKLTVSKQTNKPEMRGKASPVHVETTGAICRLFFLFPYLSLHLHPFIPPPTGSLILSVSPSLTLFSLSLLWFCLPSPAPPRSRARSSSSCSSLQYTVPGGDSSKSNCLSISHQYTASQGSCPLKTMKVGLSAEPRMGFNYTNE